MNLALSLLAAASSVSAIGVELDVPDVAAAVRFYREALDFREHPHASCSREPVLVLGTTWLALRESSAAPPAPGAPRAVLELRTKSLDAMRERALRAGARCHDPRPRTRAFGRSLALVDPAGHAIELVDVDGDGPGDDASVLAIGVHGVDGSDAESALPLARDGSVPIVLHAGANGATKGARTSRVLAEAGALDDDVLAQLGIAAGAAPRISGALGRSALALTPCGVELRVLERSPARLAFEHLRALTGTWTGTSTKGWTEEARFEAIAGGSVILETSLDAHPGERMASAVHMDGGELVLTHYCIAGNQPRLVARRFEDGGRTIVFEFKDATNLASRDQGHMDACTVTIDGPDAFRSTWSWYQDGKTSWMEEIRYARSGKSTAR